MKLYVHLLQKHDHPALIETLRLLYIEALAELSTHPIPANTPEQQQLWWSNLEQWKESVWLVSLPETPWDIIGFIKLRAHAGYYSPMFALTKRVHGRGLGKEMIQFYLSQVPRGIPLRGEQLISNKAICHLNKKAGWWIISEEKGVQTLYHPNEPSNVGHPQSAYDEIIRYNEEGI